MTRRTNTVEVVLHSPNPIALAGILQTGGGIHRTPIRETRRDRRNAREMCRSLER